MLRDIILSNKIEKKQVKEKPLFLDPVGILGTDDVEIRKNSTESPTLFTVIRVLRDGQQIYPSE